MGRPTTYKRLVDEVNVCAKALKTLGVREGDKVTIAMPNCPQAVVILYATNKKMTGAKVTTFKGGKKTKLKVSGLKKGKTYYVRYRPYKNKGGRIYYGVLKKTLKVRVK